MQRWVHSDRYLGAMDRNIKNLLEQFLRSILPQGQTASTHSPVVEESRHSTVVGKFNPSPIVQESNEIPGLFYIFEPEVEKLDLLSYAYAQKEGLVRVQESGWVPELRVEILSPQPILFVEGDVLLGGMQNRVVDATVILSHGVRKLPVRCVEEGRWHLTTSPRFEDSNFSMPADVLKEKFASGFEEFKQSGRYTSDQGTVWFSVQQHLDEKRISSATSDLSESFRAKQLSSTPRTVSQPARGQTGFLFYFNKHQAVLEKAATPELWTDRHEKFIKSIVMERAEVNKSILNVLKTRHYSAKEAAGFLNEVLNDLSLTPGKKPPVGMGTYHVLDHQGVKALALNWRGRQVHVRCFLN